MLQPLILLTLLFYFLFIITEEYFVPVLEKFSKKFKLSSEVTGATIMAVGSSAPELFTSLFAVLRAKSVPSLGAGTIVGSAIFNVLVITGASLLVKRAKLTYQPILRDLIFYALTVAVLFLSFQDNKITFPEALLFVLLYLFYLYIVKNWARWLKYSQKNVEIKKEDVEEQSSLFKFKPITLLFDKIYNLFSNLFYQLFISIAFIGITTHFLVESAVLLAENIGVSPAVIGLTVLAVGTSVPDLLSSVIVARKGYTEMAVTNSLGSNIFDILFGLGFPYAIFFLAKGVDKTIPVVSYNLKASILLLFFTIFVTLFIFTLQRWKTKRRSGGVLILIYLLYLFYMLLNLK